MAKFNAEDIVVFDQNDISVVQTDGITVKIEGKEATFFIRDFRNKSIQSISAFFLGAIIGISVFAILFS